MAIRDKIAENSAKFLDPGEQIQSVFCAQTASSFLLLLAYLPFFLVNRNRCVVATDRRILVLDSGKLSATKPKSVVRVLPRSTRIGPPTGAWYVTEALGETLHIAKRFHEDINTADAAASGESSPPPPTV